MSKSQLHTHDKLVLGSLVAIVPLVLLLLKQKKKSQEIRRTTTTESIGEQQQQQQQQHEYPPFNSLDFRDTIKAYTSKNILDMFQKWQIEKGDIVRMKQLNERRMVVITGNLPLILTVLNDRTSLKTPARNVSLFHDFGNDLFTAEGSFHKHSRKAILAAFTSSCIKLTTSTAVENTKEFMKQLDNLEQLNQPFDVHKDMNRLAFNISLDSLFQYPPTTEEYDMLMRSSDIIITELKKANVPYRWKFGRFIPAVREAREHGRKTLAFGYKILEAYRNLDNPRPNTVIDCINNNQSYVDDRERASDVVAMIFASVELTFLTVSFVLKMLSKHTTIQTQLRNELRSLPEEERVNSSFLHCIIKETMRLHPVSGTGSSRITSRDIVVPKNEKDDTTNDETYDETTTTTTFMIPKGSVVFCNPMLVHRNPKYYTDPLVFNPNRWIDPSQEEKDAFIGFALGRRSCFGRPFANSIMNHLISILIINFELTIENEGYDEVSLFNTPKELRVFAKRCV